MYQSLTRSKKFLNIKNGGSKTASALSCVQMLRALTNHPLLVHKSCKENGALLTGDSTAKAEFKRMFALFGEGYEKRWAVADSGKLKVLRDLVAAMLERSSDKVAVVHCVRNFACFIKAMPCGWRSLGTFGIVARCGIFVH